MPYRIAVRNLAPLKLRPYGAIQICLLLLLLLEEEEEEDRATSTGNMYRKFGEIYLELRFLRCASGQTNKQTNKHTDTLITIPRTPMGGKVKSKVESKSSPVRTSRGVAITVQAGENVR